ncbi:MAG: 2,3-bisphosphoglycerate-independent phosphoglycerate mutase [Candidatus Azambacteria bacterium]|nr:2,3-bisphosphoglycerate-independent phosphoglycerate mutase [Candidatus Azambacteria bacterium]
MYKPVILVILDGYGRGPENAANAIFKAKKPNFDFIEKNFPMTNLQASGIAVGQPWGEEGNSEVGHLNLGAGRIVYQYLPRIIFAIRDGSFYANSELLGAAEHIRKNNSAFHIMGLIGSGNVHSYIDHLYAILEFAKREKLDKVFIHAFTDGRDSPPKEALDFYEKVQNKIAREYPFAKIVSLIGRHFAMDRDNSWDKTEKAYRLLTETSSEVYNDVKSALQSDYDKGLTDEFIEPKAIQPPMGSSGLIKNGDSIVYLDFREDSARQLTRAFVEENFNKFVRDKINNLYFATMTRYEESLPIHVLFEPLKIENSLAKMISDAGKTQVHIAETEKYAHITYFFNGGIENSFPKEERIIVPTMRDSNFEENQAMSAEEITEKIIESINSKKYDFIVVNYANADMIAHTGNFKSTVSAIEILDKEMGQLMAESLKANAVLIITSDHGNADEMIDLLTGQPHTEHTSNPVPFYLIANDFKQEKTPEEVELGKIGVDGILADVTPTILELLGLKQPPEMTGKSLLRIWKNQ